MFSCAKLDKMLAIQSYLRYFRSLNTFSIPMATILAFAGSNSSTSINFKLVQYTVGLIKSHDVQLLNMVNFPFPMYSEDREREEGYSNSLIELKDDIAGADGLLISVNEHNSNPSAYFKNLIDWLSRLELKFLEGTKVMLMSTSRGKRGGSGSLEVVKNILPRFGAEVVVSFSLPQYYQNFDPGNGISDEALAAQHKQALAEFLSKI